MTMQHHNFQTLVSETHSLHAKANGKIQLVIEVDEHDRKAALEAFSRPGAALAVVRLPSIFDRQFSNGAYVSEENEEEAMTFH